MKNILSVSIIDQEDSNHYVFGKMDKHNVVVTNLAAGTYGIAEASSTATNMMRSFPNVRNGVVLMVGICGGVWSKENDIRLGDVVVGEPKGLYVYRNMNHMVAIRKNLVSYPLLS